MTLLDLFVNFLLSKHGSHHGAFSNELIGYGFSSILFLFNLLHILLLSEPSLELLSGQLQLLNCPVIYLCPIL